MTLSVVTSIYGGYDKLLDPPAQTVDVAEWVCVTDDPELRSDVWRIVVDPYPGEAPRLAAKHAKVAPHKYVSPDADRVVRMDGATYLKHDRSLEQLLGSFHPDAVLAQFPHPARNCIYDEVEAAATQPKYTGQPLREQVEDYRADGHPAGWGLWETGVLVINYRYGRDLPVAFGRAWLAEMYAWSLQDQLSEPAVLRRFGLWPASLPGSYWDNPIVGRQEHLLDA